MNCKQFQRMLEKSPEAESDKQKAHLESCAKCSELIADLKYIEEQARLLLTPGEDPHPRVWFRIKQILDSYGLIHTLAESPSVDSVRETEPIFLRVLPHPRDKSSKSSHSNALEFIKVLLLPLALTAIDVIVVMSVIRSTGISADLRILKYNALLFFCLVGFFAVYLRYRPTSGSTPFDDMATAVGSVRFKMEAGLSQYLFYFLYLAIRGQTKLFTAERTADTAAIREVEVRIQAQLGLL